MALRWKAYAPNQPLKAVEVQDLADNGVIQLDAASDLADPNLVNANVVYVIAEAKPYIRQAAGVGADKWKVFSGGLPGLGGWAEVTALTGSPKRYEYTDGNEAWTAFEWTQDGTITTSGGLVETLLCGGGGQGSGAWVSPGAYLVSGVEKISTGQLDVHVGAAANADNTSGGASWVGNSAPYDLFANGGGVTAGPDTGPGQGPYASYPSSITGTERFFCAYGASYVDAKYAEPGQGGHYQGGSAQQPGVVIICVPKDKVTATGGWV